MGIHDWINFGTFMFSADDGSLLYSPAPVNYRWVGICTSRTLCLEVDHAHYHSITSTGTTYTFIPCWFAYLLTTYIWSQYLTPTDYLEGWYIALTRKTSSSHVTFCARHKPSSARTQQLHIRTVGHSVRSRSPLVLPCYASTLSVKGRWYTNSARQYINSATLSRSQFMNYPPELLLENAK